LESKRARRRFQAALVRLPCASGTRSTLRSCLRRTLNDDTASGHAVVNLRLIAKRVAQAVSLVIAFPFALLCGFGRIVVLFNIFGHLYALGPAMLGNLLRAGYYRLTLRDCSINTNISFGALFPTPDVSIGSFVSIGSYSIIGRTRIGSRTQIGSHVQIPSGRHEHPRDAEGRMMASVEGSTTIGTDCWIGTAAVILANVGNGSTIGAGSVVVKEIPPGMVAVGNPARVVRPAIPVHE
jgi:virginiamycin A acetyltransferase